MPEHQSVELCLPLRRTYLNKNLSRSGVFHPLGQCVQQLCFPRKPVVFFPSQRREGVSRGGDERQRIFWSWRATGMLASWRAEITLTMPMSFKLRTVWKHHCPWQDLSWFHLFGRASSHLRKGGSLNSVSAQCPPPSVSVFRSIEAASER